jgi:hypothetical protein
VCASFFAAKMAEKRSFSPALLRSELFGNFLCSKGPCEGRICLAGLALRPATDVIIRKIDRPEPVGALLAGYDRLP